MCVLFPPNVRYLAKTLFHLIGLIETFYGLKTKKNYAKKQKHCFEFQYLVQFTLQIWSILVIWPMMTHFTMIQRPDFLKNFDLVPRINFSPSCIRKSISLVQGFFPQKYFFRNLSTQVTKKAPFFPLLFYSSRAQKID